MRHPAVEGHRRGLELEGAAWLVGAFNRSIEAVVRRRGADQVRVVVRQADHRENLTAADIHDDTATTNRPESPHRGDQLLAHRGLHLQVERKPQRLRIGSQTLVEIFLDAGETILLDVYATQYLGGGPAERVLPMLGRAEIHAGNTQVVDRLLLPRRDFTHDIN